MSYVDGFVIPVPEAKLDAYKAMAEMGAKVWLDHGALEYHECVLDDSNNEFGIPFPANQQVKEGETVIFAWIKFESRAHRDEVNGKVMEDPRMKECPPDMPFDCKRMVYGGFRVIV